MFIREDADLNAMTDKQKRFVLRLMTDRVVDRFFEDFEKKMGQKVPKTKTEICFVTCDDCRMKKNKFF